MTPRKRICCADEACSLARCASTRKQQRNETTQAVAVLNSQILNRRVLGFGATPHRKKQEARRGRPARGTRRSNNTRRGGRQDTTAQQSYLIHIPNFLSLVRRNSYTITSSLLRTRHVFLDPYSSTIAKLLTHCTAAAACYVSSSCLHCGAR